MRWRRIRHVMLLTAFVLSVCIILAGEEREAPSPAPARNLEATPPIPPSPAPTQEPTAAPAQTAKPETYVGVFELPLQGATGYAAVDLNLRSAPDASAEKLQTVPAGAGFRIVREDGGYWYVEGDGFSGYLAHRYCMVNLPDVIPSIVYDNTNAYAARLRSSGKALPGVTGEALYENKAYNERLGREEFIMPVLYAMAHKIQAAQRAALSRGDSLKIYEAYRPHQVQRRVVNALSALAERDAQVRAGISTAPWKASWFASQGTSHHQRGCAIDVSLVQVERTEERVCGPYAYREVTGYSEYSMPTAIHELSMAAAAFSQPVSSASASAWRSASPAKSMNRAALALQKYCTDAGLTPLASEWWHFNDLEVFERVKSNAGKGGFTLNRVYSAAP